MTTWYPRKELHCQSHMIATCIRIHTSSIWWLANLIYINIAFCCMYGLSHYKTSFTPVQPLLLCTTYYFATMIMNSFINTYFFDCVVVCVLFLTLIVLLDTILNSPPFQPIFIKEHSAVSCQTSCSSNGSTINLLWHLINSQQTPIPTDRFCWL